MLYCTYDQYQTAGGTLDEAAFTPLCFRASKLIDRATFGRPKPTPKAAPTVPKLWPWPVRPSCRALNGRSGTRCHRLCAGRDQRQQRRLCRDVLRRSTGRKAGRRSVQHSFRLPGARPPRPAVSGVFLMQCSVTVVNLIHDTATEIDRPVCHVIPGCSWREKLDTSGGDPQRTVHVRLPPAAGYLPYFQWAKLPPGEKAAHWTLKRGGKLICGAVRSLTEAEYAALEKTHICCTVAAVSDNREPLLPHFHVEGS